MSSRTRTARAPLIVVCASLVCLAATGTALAAPALEREPAWLAMLRTWAAGTKPARTLVTIVPTGSAPRLTVRLSVPAGSAAARQFQDGLYGAYAFTFAGGRWRRVDTADFRTAVLKVLRPGQHATVRLPVARAASYRVAVRTSQGVAWVDYRPKP